MTFGGHIVDAMARILGAAWNVVETQGIKEEGKETESR